jgi:hypothetical protein
VDYPNIVCLTFAHSEAGGINVAGRSKGIRIVNNESYDIAWVSFGTGAIWVWTDMHGVKIFGQLGAPRLRGGQAGSAGGDQYHIERLCRDCPEGQDRPET